MMCNNRVAVCAGSAAAIAAAAWASLVAKSDGTGALSSDFWRGLPVGLFIGIAIVALVTAVKAKNSAP
jgi:hypothetical protein